jgi:hypothetical protein
MAPKRWISIRNIIIYLETKPTFSFMNIYILYNNNEATVTEWWLSSTCVDSHSGINHKCIIDFDAATNLLLKQVYSCAVVDACLIWTDLIILISRPVRWDKLDQSTHFKGKLHKLPIEKRSMSFSLLS